MRARGGFTILELILVIAIIGILFFIVVIAINPSKSQGEQRNVQRRNDVFAILNTLYDYSLEHRGRFPSSITSTPKEICRTGAESCVNGVDLSALAESFASGVPMDPQAPETGTGTLYTIVRDAKGHITVAAPKAEQGATISATR